MKSIKGLALIAVSILLTIYAWASAGMTNFIVPGLALTYPFLDIFTCDSERPIGKMVPWHRKDVRLS